MKRRFGSLFFKSVILAGAFTLAGGTIQAAPALSDVAKAYQSGQYFTAARLAFNEANHAPTVFARAQAYAWVTDSLVKAGLDQAAFYFFIRTLQFRDRATNQRILDLAPLFIERVGADAMRKFLAQFTRPEDYSPRARNAYWILNAKDRLLKGQYAEAMQASSAVSSDSSLYPIALQIQGTALTLMGQLPAAAGRFRECVNRAKQRTEDGQVFENAPASELYQKWKKVKAEAADDLAARCGASHARVVYEMGNFEESDRLYSQIPKRSFVWPETLSERAWAAFARGEYNHSLGMLVTYNSPAFDFTYNTESSVLMAQSYLALCLFDDANKVIENFNQKHAVVAREVKQFFDSNPKDIMPYYSRGKQALKDRLHTSNLTNRFFNRFVRSPTFQNIALSEERAQAEKIAIQRLDQKRPETSTGMNAGFPGFLNVVLDWRIKTLREMGGVFVRNSLLDYHQLLISDFEKLQFMRIDILSMMKAKLQAPTTVTGDRVRGNMVPKRRNDQYLWTFNGEFWNDEIGDYVFALESECQK